MQDNSFIDDVMGFDPSNLDAFQEKPSNSSNVNAYKPNPAKSVSDDGHYRAVVRVVYNPYDVKKSIVHQATYAMSDQNGFFMVKSALGDGDRNCPIFKSWKKLWFSEDEAKKEWAKKMYEKNESDWCLVQVLEDQNQPDMVGQIKVMKLPKAIYTKLKAKTNPAPETGKAPVAIMDYLIGLPLELDVAPGPDDPKQPSRKQREISYDLCEFSTDFAPIIRTDGSPLFTDEELELIEKFDAAKKKVTKAKTEKAKNEAQKELDGLKDELRVLYRKALDYLKEEAQVIDLVQECAYQPWTPEQEARINSWINTVAAMQDPKTGVVNEGAQAPAPTAEPSADPVDDMVNGEDGPLPF